MTYNNDLKKSVILSVYPHFIFCISSKAMVNCFDMGVFFLVYIQRPIIHCTNHSSELNVKKKNETKLGYLDEQRVIWE